jgi:hypothetical protein
MEKQDGCHHLKSGHKSGFRMVGPSLDRFINKGHQNILFIPKRSRIERKYPVRISNGKNKMAAAI